MMLNSRFELSKIEKNTRVEREICLATLENREWKENLFLPLSKIESRKRNGNYQIFEIEREISLSTLDFSLESETLVNACGRVLGKCKTNSRKPRRGLKLP